MIRRDGDIARGDECGVLLQQQAHAAFGIYLLDDKRRGLVELVFELRASAGGTACRIGGVHVFEDEALPLLPFQPRRQFAFLRRLIGGFDEGDMRMRE